MLFGIDILLTFNSGFYKNGMLIMNRLIITLTYLKTWFLLDVLSTFPYELVINSFSTENSTNHS